PPTPPKGVTPLPGPAPSAPDAHELPTMKMDDAALVEAEKAFAARQASLAEKPQGAAGVSVAFGDDEETSTEVDPPDKYSSQLAPPAPVKPISVPPPPVIVPPAPPEISAPRATPAATQQIKTPAATPKAMEFDLSDERTGARRAMRSSPMMRPVKAPSQPQLKPVPKPGRRWALWVGAPLVLAALAALYVVSTAEAEARPGKLVITPSPSIAA